MYGKNRHNSIEWKLKAKTSHRALITMYVSNNTSPTVPSMHIIKTIIIRLRVHPGLKTIPPPVPPLNPLGSKLIIYQQTSTQRNNHWSISPIISLITPFQIKISQQINHLGLRTTQRPNLHGLKIISKHRLTHLVLSLLGQRTALHLQISLHGQELVKAL